MTISPQQFFAINNSVSKGTGFTPAFLMFGFNPRKPNDNSYPSIEPSVDLNKSRMEARAKIMKNQLAYVEKQKPINSAIQPGSIVFLKQHQLMETGKKFTKRFHGPYLVLHRDGAVVRLLNISKDRTTSANISQCKCYKGSYTLAMRRAVKAHFPGLNPKALTHLTSNVEEEEEINDDDYDNHSMVNNVSPSVNSVQTQPLNLLPRSESGQNVPLSCDDIDHISVLKDSQRNKVLNSGSSCIPQREDDYEVNHDNSFVDETMNHDPMQASSCSNLDARDDETLTNELSQRRKSEKIMSLSGENNRANDNRCNSARLDLPFVHNEESKRENENEPIAQRVKRRSDRGYRIPPEFLHNFMIDVIDPYGSDKNLSENLKERSTPWSPFVFEQETESDVPNLSSLFLSDSLSKVNFDCDKIISLLPSTSNNYSADSKQLVSSIKKSPAITARKITNGVQKTVRFSEAIVSEKANFNSQSENSFGAHIVTEDYTSDCEATSSNLERHTNVHSRTIQRPITSLSRQRTRAYYRESLNEWFRFLGNLDRSSPPPSDSDSDTNQPMASSANSSTGGPLVSGDHNGSRSGKHYNFFQIIQLKLRVSSMPNVGVHVLEPFTFHGFRGNQIHSMSFFEHELDFVCELCEHIVRGLATCDTCKSLYCSECLQYLKKMRPIIRPYICAYGPGEFLCVSPECIKTHRLGEIGTSVRRLQEIYEEVLFSCPFTLCREKFSYVDYENHVSSCQKGNLDNSPDYTMCLYRHRNEELHEAIFATVPGSYQPDFVSDSQAVTPLRGNREMSDRVHHSSRSSPYEVRLTPHPAITGRSSDTVAPLAGPESGTVPKGGLRRPYYAGHWTNDSRRRSESTPRDDNRSRSEQEEGEAARNEPSQPAVQDDWHIDWDGAAQQQEDNPQPDVRDRSPRVRSVVVVPERVSRRGELAPRFQRPRTEGWEAERSGRNSSSFRGRCAVARGWAQEPAREERVREAVPEWHIRAEVRPHLTEEQLNRLLGVYTQLGMSGRYSGGDGLYVMDAQMREKIDNWARRTQLPVPRFENWIETVIARNLDNKFPVDSVVALQVECGFVRTPAQPRTGEPRAFWISIVKQDMTVVYETFIRYPQQTIVQYYSQFHGVNWRQNRHGLTLKHVRRQIIEYLGTARFITGADPANQLRHLGFTEAQIAVLRHKFVDICQMYSPRADLTKFSFRCIVHLISRGDIEFPEPIAPAYTAQLAMKLFYLHRTRSEGHQGNWGPNAWVASLLYEHSMNSREWPRGLFRTCFGNRYRNLPVWEAGRYANPEFWGGTHPSVEDDPRHGQIEVPRSIGHDLVPPEWGWNPEQEPDRNAHDWEEEFAIAEQNELPPRYPGNGAPVNVVPDVLSVSTSGQVNISLPVQEAVMAQEESSSRQSSSEEQVGQEMEQGEEDDTNDGQLSRPNAHEEPIADEDESYQRDFRPVDQLLYGNSSDGVVTVPTAATPLPEDCRDDDGSYGLIRDGQVNPQPHIEVGTKPMVELGSQDEGPVQDVEMPTPSGKEVEGEVSTEVPRSSGEQELPEREIQATSSGAADIQHPEEMTDVTGHSLGAKQVE